MNSMIIESLSDSAQGMIVIVFHVRCVSAAPCVCARAAVYGNVRCWHRLRRLRVLDNICLSVCLSVCLSLCLLVSLACLATTDGRIKMACVSLSVCLSVCLLVTLACLATTDGRIKMTYVSLSVCLSVCWSHWRALRQRMDRSR